MTFGHVAHLDHPVSRLVIGSMAFSFDDLPRTFGALDAFTAAGGNAVDTANVYGPSPHRAVGEYLRVNGRDALVLMDKVAHPGPAGPRVSRAEIRDDFRTNSERMGTEMTDVLVLHRDDPAVPVGEIVDWLDEMADEGSIRAYGASNWSWERFDAARAYAAEKGRRGFSVTSPQVVLATPNEPMWTGCVTLDDADVAAYAEAGTPIFSWSSGAGGYFAGRSWDDIDRVYASDVNAARRERARKLAEEKGTNPTAIAVAWVLAQPGRVHAIIGPRNAEEVRENLAVLDVTLTPDEVRYLRDGD